MKILLIRLGRIGDIVLSLGVANAIKETFHDSDVTLLTDEKARDLVFEHPALDNVIYLNKSLLKKMSKIKAFFSIVKTIKELKKNKFDIAIDLQCFLETAFIAYLTSAKKRVGYNERMRGIFYNIKVKPIAGKRHDFLMQLKLAEAIGVNIDSVINKVSNGIHPTIKISDKARLYRDIFLKSVGINEFNRIVGINPGASVDYKRWGKHNFAILADKLIEKYNVKVIIFWGPEEEKIAMEVKNLMVNAGVLCCKTNLGELAAFAERCNIFITNDSGPMHIAYAVKVPTFAVFIKEHSDPDISGPIGYKNMVFNITREAKEDENYSIIEELVKAAGEVL